jgi:hypothetical protein
MVRVDEIDYKTLMILPFLLYCFENMSMLKINYEKSEIFVLGSSVEEEQRVVEILNCNIGKVPLKYLGVMVDNNHMTIFDLSYIYQKVEKRVSTWQSVGLSSGGKMMLVFLNVDVKL